MRIKKRVTALVLCAAMIITSLSVPETAEKVLAAGESQTKVSSSDKTVLKDFGFDLSGEYAMDALNDTQKMAKKPMITMLLWHLIRKIRTAEICLMAEKVMLPF